MQYSSSMLIPLLKMFLSHWQAMQHKVKNQLDITCSYSLGARDSFLHGGNTEIQYLLQMSFTINSKYRVGQGLGKISSSTSQMSELDACSFCDSFPSSIISGYNQNVPHSRQSYDLLRTWLLNDWDCQSHCSFLREEFKQQKIKNKIK